MTDGEDSFLIEEIAEVPNADLNVEERYWIAELDCMVPGGYNLTEGGDGGPWASEAKAKLSATRCAMIDDLRHPKLAGMPVRFTYRNYQETGEQIVLLKHPLCASKCFSVKGYGDFESAKAAALAFHAELEAKGAPAPKRPRRGTEELPKGMYETPTGFGYSKIINGKTYRKQFASTKWTKEENRRLAFAHFQELLATHTQPPP